MESDQDQLPAAVLAEARVPLPADIAGFHDALLQAADEHDPIRMDHLVHGWAEARADLLPGRNEAEHQMHAVLDRRLGQVLFGAGHPAAGHVLADALTAATASGDEVEALRWPVLVHCAVRQGSEAQQSGLNLAEGVEPFDGCGG